MAAESRTVELYVYDLSQGLARQFSRQLLGTYIDAVYHTSIVLGSREIYYGAGIQISRPGRTHHGPPMEKIKLGTTTLPDDVVLEYLESMKSIYSPEAYDLFMHNCNNFSNDLSVFLTGQPIPSHITSLPQTVLNTPFGMMLRPQIDAAMRPITQAPTVEPGMDLGGHGANAPATHVKVPTSLAQFEGLMKEAEKGCAVVFFTSATCAPCRALYPVYEQKAKDMEGRMTFIKVDVGAVREVGAQYRISATPTFMTFSRGEKVDEWKGADRQHLNSKIDLLAHITYPAHPHTKQDLSITFSQPMKPLTYPKYPPIDKVRTKLSSIAPEIVAHPAFTTLTSFLTHRSQEGAIEAPLPDLAQWSALITSSIENTAVDKLFPLVDLFRAALVDPRVSSFFVAQDDLKTVQSLANLISGNEDSLSAIPYQLRMLTLQSLSNLFSSLLAGSTLTAQPIASSLVAAISTSLLDKSHTGVRGAAGSVAFNMALHVQKARSTQNAEAMDEGTLVELLVCVLEALGRIADGSNLDQVDGQGEVEPGVVKAMVVSTLLLVFCVPREHEVWDVLEALDAAGTVRRLGEGKVGEGMRVAGLCAEVVGVLGFRWPEEEGGRTRDEL